MDNKDFLNAFIDYALYAFGDNEPHIALDNIRERLKLICNGELAISSRDCGGTVVTIRIPLKAES